MLAPAIGRAKRFVDQDRGRMLDVSKQLSKVNIEDLSYS